MTFLNDAASDVAALRDAQPICFTLPASIEQAAANEEQERASTGLGVQLVGHWLPVSIDH